MGVLKCYTSQVPGFNVYNTRYDKKDMLQSTTFIVLDFGDAWTLNGLLDYYFILGMVQLQVKQGI